MTYLLPTMISREQAAEFETRGILKLAGLIAPGEAIAAGDMIRALGEEHAIYSSGRWEKSDSRFGLPKPFRDDINQLSRSGRFPKLVSPPIIALCEQLVGQSLAPLSPGQQVLVTLPGGASWSVPHDVWHFDLPKLGEQASPGLQVFTFLDDVAPGGGGTLVISGSHRLLNEEAGLSSKRFKQLLQQERYFRALFDRAGPPITSIEQTKGSVGDVELEVVELTGQVGDVYLMDLRALHAPAPNGADKARLMLTCRLPRSSIAAKYGQAT